MFKQAETILNPIVFALGVLFLILIILRLRALLIIKKSRIPIWNKECKLVHKIAAWIKTISLPLMAAGIIYFLFIELIFTAVIYSCIKTFFIMVFSVWTILETYTSLSIPKNLPDISITRRIFYYLAIVICLAGAVFLFPKIIQSYHFPKASECVLLDLPIRGEWLVGHAGSTTMTNAHTKNRYAIDFFKIGHDGRFFKEPEENVTDFYSYGEPVYAPTSGRITEVVDTLTSNIFGEPDRINLGGNYVILEMENGIYFYVAHLMKNKISVKEGQTVKAGDLLGFIGNSGNTFFPHLHIHVQNNPKANMEERITYPFRFKKLKRKRLILWRTIGNGYLIRNDRIID